ncbi:MAG: hypothetical protein ACRDTT_30110 [Pseudonocardiaceae bacterium]
MSASRQASGGRVGQERGSNAHPRDLSLVRTAVAGTSSSLRSEHDHDPSAPPRASVVAQAFTSTPVEYPVLNAAAGLATQHWLRTQALGSLVDRVACAWMRWHLLDNTANDAGGVARAQVHLALHQFGEVVTAYDDLLDDLRTCVRCPPSDQALAEPAATA